MLTAVLVAVGELVGVAVGVIVGVGVGWHFLHAMTASESAIIKVADANRMTAAVAMAAGTVIRLIFSIPLLFTTNTNTRALLSRGNRFFRKNRGFALYFLNGAISLWGGHGWSRKGERAFSSPLPLFPHHNPETLMRSDYA